MPVLVLVIEDGPNHTVTTCNKASPFYCHQCSEGYLRIA